MKITLSKSQWEFLGKKAGWVKEAKIEAMDNKIMAIDSFAKLLFQELKTMPPSSEKTEILDKIISDIARMKDFDMVGRAGEMSEWGKEEI